VVPKVLVRGKSLLANGADVRPQMLGGVDRGYVSVELRLIDETFSAKLARATV